MERGVEYLHVMRIYIQVSLPWIGDYGSEQQHPLVRSPKLNTLMLHRGRIVDLLHWFQIHQVSICCHLSLDIWAPVPIL